MNRAAVLWLLAAVLWFGTLGIRPLCYAHEGPLFAAASESVALHNLGFGDVRSLEPGEMIVIQDNRLRREVYLASARLRHAQPTPTLRRITPAAAKSDTFAE